MGEKPLLAKFAFETGMDRKVSQLGVNNLR